MKYDIEKRAFFVKKIYESKSVALVQRAWRSKYKNIKAPYANTIKSAVEKFEKIGSINNSSR